MARIRIVDEWLRSPVSVPSRRRAIMVVAEKWAEQRVLMRAFANSADQTRPTIMLHGAELAISPAGTDPHGEWGLHVEPPVDGRAQELRAQLETAAKRLAGSKGNPPRLVDEASGFDAKPTVHWAPGAPRERESSYTRGHRDRSGPGYYEPAEGGGASRAATGSPEPRPKTGAETVVESPRQRGAPAAFAGGQSAYASSHAAGAEHMRRTPPFFAGAPQQAQSPAPARARQKIAPAPTRQIAPAQADQGAPAGNAAPRRGRRRGWTSPIPSAGGARPREKNPLTRTMPGFAISGAPSGPRGDGAADPSRSSAPRAERDNLARVVNHTMPVGFRLSDQERNILNALGRGESLSAGRIAEIVGVSNGMEWMEALMTKLAEHGLDLIAPGDDDSGEPTYVLRR